MVSSWLRAAIKIRVISSPHDDHLIDQIIYWLTSTSNSAQKNYFILSNSSIKMIAKKYKGLNKICTHSCKYIWHSRFKISDKNIVFWFYFRFTGLTREVEIKRTVNKSGRTLLQDTHYVLYLGVYDFGVRQEIGGVLADKLAVFHSLLFNRVRCFRRYVYRTILGKGCNLNEFGDTKMIVQF